MTEKELALLKCVNDVLTEKTRTLTASSEVVPLQLETSAEKIQIIFNINVTVQHTTATATNGHALATGNYLPQNKK